MVKICNKTETDSVGQSIELTSRHVKPSGCFCLYRKNGITQFYSPFTILISLAPPPPPPPPSKLLTQNARLDLRFHIHFHIHFHFDIQIYKCETRPASTAQNVK